MRNIVLAAIFFFVLHGAAAAEMVSVAAELVNMRSGPGHEHEVAWELGKGYPLKVLEERGEWLKVTDYQDDVGWVQKEMVTAKPSMIVGKKIVNIRSGPGENYRIVRQAENGVVFFTLETKGSWVKVMHEEEDVSGWVLRSLLWGW